MAIDYQAFVAGKVARQGDHGTTYSNPSKVLFQWQSEIVAWAVKRGRAAIFADCGLGKTLMQLEWAKQWRKTLIVCPLAVAGQTIREAQKLGLRVVEVTGPGSDDPLQIVNYEKVHKFVGAEYDGIVLDESSILKSVDGRTRTMMLRDFVSIPHRLCCTATPAPNDMAELANHAEFLGAMRRGEMLASFFVHDDAGWRLKGHAANDFWHWVSSWAVFMRRPSDVGHDDGPFVLPTLTVDDEVVPCEWRPEGQLFADIGSGIGGRLAARRGTIKARVKRAVEIMRQSWHKQQNRNEPRCVSGTNATGNTSENTERSTPRNAGDDREIGTQPTLPTGTNVKEASGHTESATRARSRTGNSSPPTGSRSARRRISTPSRVGDASFADVNSLEAESTDHTSITTTPLEGSVDCCVRRAISDSGSFKTTRNGSGRLRTTSKTPYSHPSMDHWLVWVGLNAEQDELERELGDSCVSIRGSTPDDKRIEYERRWREGDVPILITKTSQFGFGMNWQHCHQVMFLGLGDSYEQYYQAIRRCWRFGQKKPVRVVIVIGDAETAVAANVKRKEEEVARMFDGVIESVREFERAELKCTTTTGAATVGGATERGQGWTLMHGDCVERIAEVKTGSVGLSIFSPPFASLYTYSASDRDMGNCKDAGQFFEHFRYLIPELLRVTMPGRRCCVHCASLGTTLATHGVIGWYDFRGDIIREFIKHGWVYDGEIVIDKDPQAQAIRTHAKGLLFVQKERDAAWLRPAMADYIIPFRAPGDNPEPVKSDVTNNEWIEFARPIWYGIRETETLNAAEAREEKDEKHICPLQLETIRRCVRLWTNRGDLVLSPFAGIGSEGYVAVKEGRRAVGIELKESYFRTAVRNMLRSTDQQGLFGGVCNA